MELNKYQELAVKTAGPDREPKSLGLGVVGEAGEVAEEVGFYGSTHANHIAELLKKAHRPNRSIQLDLLASEIGDELWYLSVLADTYGLKLDDIAVNNIAKLEKRYG